MTWEHRGELRADPGAAPGERNIVARPRRSSIWPSIAVVAVAAAFGGVIWFAYRDSREAVEPGHPPLVKAAAGPVKVKPDQPGGQDIPFQDSTVYDRLDKGAPKPGVERILPPPETPVPRPAASASPADPGSGQTDGSAIPAPLPPPSDSSPTALAPPPGALITAPTAAPPASLSRAAAPSAAKQPTPAMAPKTVASQADSIAALESRALASMAETPATKALQAGKGGYGLQLSAVQSQGAITAEWTRLKRRFPELASLTLTSSETEVPGKGKFYRLRAGPLDAAGAKSMCDRLQAQGLGCIVIKPQN